MERGCRSHGLRLSPEFALAHGQNLVRAAGPSSAMKNRRVPVILQMSETECGAVCLAMILGYYGRHTSIEECRELCGAGRDGSSAEDIARAARLHGLSVKALQCVSHAVANAQLPAV